jgi:hypothetical protein
MKKELRSIQHLTWFLIFVLAGGILVPSCRINTVICGDPLPAYLEIALVDAKDSLLIGTVYNPDSIKLTLDNHPLDIQILHGYILIGYGGMEIYNLKDYLLYLNYKDTDTLNLAVSSHYDDHCGTTYRFSGLKYNSKTISPFNSLTYKVVK